MDQVLEKHAAPEAVATQIVSALPLARTTFHKADAPPAHTGKSSMATRVLHHFGMGEI